MVTFSTFPKVVNALEAQRVPATTACSVIVAAATASPHLRVSEDNLCVRWSVCPGTDERGGRWGASELRVVDRT